MLSHHVSSLIIRKSSHITFLWHQIDLISCFLIFMNQQRLIMIRIVSGICHQETFEDFFNSLR